MSKDILLPFKMITETSQEWYRAQSLFYKEPETVSWIQFFFGNNDVFYDIGSSVGLYTLLAKRCYPDMRVYSFEPIEMNYKRMLENIELNKFTDVTTYQVALSDKDGNADMYITGDRVGQACARLHRPIEQHIEDGYKATVNNIPVHRLDTFIKENILPVPNHIKIDVDGAEVEVVKGMEGILDHHRLKSILVECDDDSKVEIVTYLDKFGFSYKTPFTKYAYHVKGFLLKIAKNNFLVVKKAPNFIFLRKEILHQKLLNEPFEKLSEEI